MIRSVCGFDLVGDEVCSCTVDEIAVDVDGSFDGGDRSDAMTYFAFAWNLGKR